VTRFALPDVTGALTSNADSNRTRSGLKLVGAVRFDPSCTLATERRCAVLSRVPHAIEQAKAHPRCTLNNLL
jgi:hypothetical protein